MTLYGIPNCDSVKKARTWLDDRGVDYKFHDYKLEGIDASKIKGWLTQVPLNRLLNKSSTSWRELTPVQKEQAAKPAAAIKFMVRKPTLIKRPVIEDNDGTVIAVGFNAEQYAGIWP